MNKSMEFRKEERQRENKFAKENPELGRILKCICSTSYKSDFHQTGNELTFAKRKKKYNCDVEIFL